MTASEARRHSLDLNANALTVLDRRYLVKDDHGKPVERPEDLFWGVARTIAAPDRTYGDSGVDAQLSHPDERGPSPRPAVGLLRAPGGRRALQRPVGHLRHAAGDGARA